MALAGSFLGAAGTIAGAVLSGVAADAFTAGGTRLHHRAKGWPRHRIMFAAASALAVFALAGGILTGWEAIAGKPVSAIVQGKRGSGTTLGGGTVAPSPVPSQPPSPAPYATPPTVPPSSVTPSATPSPSPSPSSLLPVSPSPSLTIPASTSPSPTPEPSTPPPTS
jgi:hypothetical protein